MACSIEMPGLVRRGRAGNYTIDTEDWDDKGLTFSRRVKAVDVYDVPAEPAAIRAQSVFYNFNRLNYDVVSALKIVIWMPCCQRRACAGHRGESQVKD